MCWVFFRLSILFQWLPFYSSSSATLLYSFHFFLTFNFLLGRISGIYKIDTIKLCNPMYSSPRFNTIVFKKDMVTKHKRNGKEKGERRLIIFSLHLIQLWLTLYQLNKYKIVRWQGEIAVPRNLAKESQCSWIKGMGGSDIPKRQDKEKT